jgi:hypothetical protein
MSEARDMPYDAARVAKSEEAVRQADRLGNEQLAYDARLALVTSATFAGFIDIGLVAFSWCAARSAKDPELFPASRGVAGLFLAGIDLLWSYKWIVQHMPLFSSITRGQIESTLDEMERRYREHGQSMRPVFLSRARAAMEIGDRDVFESAASRYAGEARDLYADCAACEAHFDVEAALYRGDLDEALNRFDHMLDSGDECAEVPHLTYATLALPLARAGDHRARRFIDRGIELCADNRDFLPQHAELMTAELALGRPEAAWQLVERYFGWAAETRVDARRLRFFAATEQTIRALGDELESDRLRALPGLDEHPSATQAEAYLASEVDRVAAAFDARNGNDAVSRRVAVWRGQADG